LGALGWGASPTLIYILKKKKKKAASLTERSYGPSFFSASEVHNNVPHLIYI